MSSGQTIILHSDSQRDFAKRMIDAAPVDAVVKVRAAKRTLEQNDKMWAMLTDLSVAKPEGRCHTPGVWKAIMMNACGHQVQFVPGIDGEVFPIGFRSSQLTKKQMIDLIEMIYWYGAQHNVKWSEPEAQERAA